MTTTQIHQQDGIDRIIKMLEMPAYSPADSELLTEWQRGVNAGIAIAHKIAMSQR